MPTDTQPTSDSFQYIWYLVSAIVGGFFTWVFKGFSAKDLLAWWKRPKLSLAISTPVYTEAKTKSADQPPVQLGPHRFYHLDVANSGRTAATSCEAELVAVDKEELGQRKTVPSSTNLCFLHWGRTPLDCAHIDIPARISRRRPSSRFLDLCTQEIAQPGRLHIFRARASAHADGLRTDYGPGTYYFTVCLRSKEHHVRPATITNALKRMEKAGLVERRRDTEDQRVSRVYLTDAGRDVRSEVERVWAELEERTFAGLDTKDRLLFRHLLLCIHKNLVHES